MDRSNELLLQILSSAIRGNSFRIEKDDRKYRAELYRLADEHHVLPLIVDSLFDGTKHAYTEAARDATVGQAQRTADFLLLMQSLSERGLQPVVVKGIVCRNLYPKPELRPSVDEDLLIRPEEYNSYRTALLAAGMHVFTQEDAYEVGFFSEGDYFYLELHKSLFPEDSDAVGSCASFFEDAVDRAVEVQLGGLTIRTLSPTDHLLFLICHAYKHFLHGGVGIRQICDLGLMAEKDGAQIDWAHIRGACEELRIETFAAALFRITEGHLGFMMPEAFADLEVDESELLEDCLSGGLYGVKDIDRAHSSTMTLEAVGANRSGRKRRGALHSVFLPLESMWGHYPYLKEHPWLLPAAWTQRVWGYLRRKKHPEPVSPTRSIRIARERIELLKKYRIIR